jgi:hypothetical protein
MVKEEKRTEGKIVFMEGAKEAMVEWVEDLARETEKIRAKAPPGRIETVGIKPIFRIFIRNRIECRIKPNGNIRKVDRVFTFGSGPTEFKIVINALFLKKAGKIHLHKRKDGDIFPVTENPLGKKLQS